MGHIQPARQRCRSVALRAHASRAKIRALECEPRRRNSRALVETKIGSLSMAYEDCPKCGQRKHQLMACSRCGYQRRPVPESTTAIAPQQPKRSKTHTRRRSKSSSSITNFEEELLAAFGVEIAHPQSPDTKVVLCRLCGSYIPKDCIQEHIRDFHGYIPKPKATETRDATPKKRRFKPQVKILQGGLPGLGKKR